MQKILVFAFSFCLLVNLYAGKNIDPPFILTQDGPTRLIINKPAEYTITVTNTGDTVAKEMVLINFLPSIFQYLSAEPLPTTVQPASQEELATVTWNLGDILPNQSIIIKLRVRPQGSGIVRYLTRLYSNSIESPFMQPLEVFEEIVVYKGIPAIHINTYDTEDPVEVGKQTIYVVEIRNEGTAPCTHILLKSKAPKGMEFVSAYPSPYKIDGDLVIFEVVPSLLPGVTLTYKITYRALQEGSAKHTAILHYREFDKDISTEEGTIIYK